MKMQLFVRGARIIDREILLTREQERIYKKMPFKERVIFVEGIAECHKADILMKYREAIRRASKYEIVLIRYPKKSKKQKNDSKTYH